MNIPFFSKKTSPISNLKKLTLQLSGMHCVACSLNITGTLEDIPGVQTADTKYAQSICTVEYDPSRVEPKAIQSAIEKLGYGCTVI